MLAGGAQSGQGYGYSRIMLIPCRDRELLVVSTGGACFCHTYSDLPEDQAGLTITPEAPFWFYVPAPVQPMIRIAPLQFASSGTVCGAPTNWRLTPPSGSPTFDVFQALSDASGSVTASIQTPASNPYGLANPVQIKLSLTGGTGPNWTPFVYGCRAFYPSETATTVGESVDALPYLMEFRLDVSDMIGGTRARATLNMPDALSVAGASAFTSMCHRAIQVLDEHGVVLDGVSDPPHWVDSYGFSADGYDRNQAIEIEVHDLWKLAEEFIFLDPVPLDGMALSDAYKLVCSMVGLPSGLVYVSASADSFLLPSTPASGGEWSFLCDVGDRGAEVLDRLHQTFAGSWFHGFRPNAVAGQSPVLSLIDPADSSGLPSVASVSLYASVEAAQAAGKGWQQVYRSYKTTVLEPEANDLYVTGRDPRTGKPIVAHKADSASQNVTTPVASRPSNWLGFIRKYGWVDPGITTIASAEYVLDQLYARLTPARTLVEFECEYLPGVWRGDLVELMRADGSSVTVRVKTFSGQVEVAGTFDGASAPDAVWRPCRYVGEVGPVAAPLDLHGTTLLAISAGWSSLRAVSKRMVKPGGDVLGRRPVVNQQEY
jgi:hypothetical protein